MNPINVALSADSNIRRYDSQISGVRPELTTLILSSSADPTTIKNKFLVGYQGWCAGRSHPYLTVSHPLDLGSIATGMASLWGPVRTRYHPFLATFDRHASPNQVIMAGYIGSRTLFLTVGT